MSDGPNWQARCKQCGEVIDLYEEGYRQMKAHLSKKHFVPIDEYYGLRKYFVELA